MEFKLPVLGEGVLEAELVAWLVQPGQLIEPGEMLCEMITDKASMDVPSPFAGTVEKLNGEPGDTLKVGDVMLTYSSGAEQEEEPAVAASVGGASRDAARSTKGSSRDSNKGNGAAPRSRISSPGSPRTTPPASPAVRQMARSMGIDLATVQGTGPGGRIVIGDLSQQIQPAAAAAPVQQRVASAVANSDLGVAGSRIKLRGLRRKIAEKMVQAKNAIPQYSFVEECDVTELLKLRKSLRETLPQVGEKTTTLAFFVKAAVAALKHVPMVNATLDEQAEEIILMDRYHIGIATATERGLMVPVVHDADKKSLFEIGQTIETLTKAARSGAIGLPDLRGSTFTVTSVGSIGGLITTPVINYPEAAILGIGKIVKRPVYDSGGQLRPADVVYLSISFDHRIVDGAVGAIFGSALCRALQNPATLLIPEATG